MFDPPHIGHLVVAAEAAWQLALDEVRLVVCARPPHRDDAWLDPELRVELVQAAVAGHPHLVASRAEVDRPGPSYTVDTLEGFGADEPDAELHLILGADQVMALSRWHRPERIAALATIAAVARDGVDRGDVQAAAVAGRVGTLEWVEIPEIGVSSTLIRRRLRDGAPVRHLVPPGVADRLDGAGMPPP